MSNQQGGRTITGFVDFSAFVGTSMKNKTKKIDFESTLLHNKMVAIFKWPE